MWNLLESCKHNRFAGADSSGFWTFHPTYVEVLQHFGMAGKFKEVTAQPVACPTSLSDDALLKDQLNSQNHTTPAQWQQNQVKTDDKVIHWHATHQTSHVSPCTALQPRTALHPALQLQPHSVRSRTCRILASDRSQSSSP